MGVKKAVWFVLGMAVEYNLGGMWRLHLGAPHAVCRSVEQVHASMNFTECFSTQCACTSLGSSISLVQPVLYLWKLCVSFTSMYVQVVGCLLSSPGCRLQAVCVAL